MDFLLKVEKSFIGYSEQLCSGKASPEFLPVLLEKYNALRSIAIYLLEVFMKQQPIQSQQCVKQFLSNQRDYTRTAIDLGISENQLRKVLKDNDSEMHDVCGSIVEGIIRARTVRGIEDVARFFPSNAGSIVYS